MRACRLYFCEAGAGHQWQRQDREGGISIKFLITGIKIADEFTLLKTLLRDIINMFYAHVNTKFLFA